MMRKSAFAPQVKNGMTRIVFVLSLSVERVRVLIIAGTPQPKPMIIGMKARPETPKRRNKRSKMKAAGAI